MHRDFFYEKVFSFLKTHKILILVPVLLVLAGGAFFIIRGIQTKKSAAVTEKSISTTSLKKRDLSTSVSITGTIASADKRAVSSEIGDVEVIAVNYSVGDYVEAGAVVVEIDDTTLIEDLQDTKDDYESTKRKQQ